MKAIWLGHGSWRIEAGDQVLLIDPWMECPTLPEDRREEAVAGATHILLTHGHFDHTDGVAALSNRLDVPVSGIFELARAMVEQGAVEGHLFNRGGTIMLGDVVVTMVPASHSSSMAGAENVGPESGYVIKADGRTLYFSGDTGITADMAWIGEFFAPDVGILSCGGYYTMDTAQAAWAAEKFFDFDVVIPSHYRTFDALAQIAGPLAEIEGVACIEPEVLSPIEL
ncbi:MAG: metal-dependent hydrolase [Shimia sp.]